MEAYTTGSSVLGIIYKDGVMLVADKQLSYGSTARYFGIKRMKKISDNCIISAGGEYSDFQEICSILEARQEDSECYADGHHISPKAFHSYSTRLLYNKRSKLEPLNVRLVVAGIDSDKPFLGTVDLYGTPIVNNFIATGMGEHLARPLIAKKGDELEKMSREEAKAFLMECMSVIFMRNTQAYHECELMSVHMEDTEGGEKKVVVDEPEHLTVDTKGKWDTPLSIKLPI
ncbi:putative Proteasome subunit beta type-4 [Monocercomonoides exilis]|uniref:putative Proteasome subunit beta type-4 n=1 Tax=Monocercomonoides exilis TaxID=2049356 RepID=UPI00355ABAC6|nr:putative Proteasome subunit beta type-4 [Monocercomonoides exilis]|eukprot:MONOS_8295.1-p1 / transcript=MONOS_8295.1 / gene=MONOS_8295 / organism=Monocercomonoides_exilis_PA203 / gene_product=Proteasome subunit beta type-4 / transcript_product=Proteasome subunit beta type-4 / location=Mono_scaffold00309:26347-27427(-) / protein_length=230 / sequence_SO=supercontig / SO=protein_coding / is_pseudo=false